MTFFYKGINISGSLSDTSGICSYIKQYITGSYNGTGLTYNPSYTAPISGVDETPNNLNYAINGVDISSYCVAAYADGVTGNLTSSKPAWCNSIRGILIGGGGGPGYEIPAQQVDNQHNHGHNSGYDYGFGATNKFYHQNDSSDHYHNPTYYGGGGGGGGFIYIKKFASVQNIDFSATTLGAGGGGVGQSGPNALAHIMTGGLYNLYVAYGGGGGETAGTGGSGGSTYGGGTSPGTPQYTSYIYATYFDGASGSNTSGGVSGAGNAPQHYPQHGQNPNGYGNGATPQTFSQNAYPYGGQAYYRVYYLTG
jgi:hypothetical protein